VPPTLAGDIDGDGDLDFDDIDDFVARLGGGPANLAARANALPPSRRGRLLPAPGVAARTPPPTSVPLTRPRPRRVTEAGVRPVHAVDAFYASLTFRYCRSRSVYSASSCWAWWEANR
jgi:hypothetical protein